MWGCWNSDSWNSHFDLDLDGAVCQNHCGAAYHQMGAGRDLQIIGTNWSGFTAPTRCGLEMPYKSNIGSGNGLVPSSNKRQWSHAWVSDDPDLYRNMASLGHNELTRNVYDYRKISNIRHTKSPNLNVSRLVLQLSWPNPMKPGVTSRMKM